MPTRKTSHSVLNDDKRSAWRLDGPTKGKCVWEMHGIWGWDRIKGEGVVLRENYFTKDPVSGRKVCILSCHLVLMAYFMIMFRLIGTQTFIFLS